MEMKLISDTILYKGSPNWMLKEVETISPNLLCFQNWSTNVLGCSQGCK